VTAHVSDIKTLALSPDRVGGRVTTGEFSGGPFHGELSRLFGVRGDEDDCEPRRPTNDWKMAQSNGTMAEKTWGQLNAAMAPRKFGTALKQQSLGQGLSPIEGHYAALLDRGQILRGKNPYANPSP